MSTNRSYQFSKVNPLVLLVGFVAVIIVLFWLAKKILGIISMIAPFLLIASLIINHKVVLGYGKWIVQSFKRNWIFGLVAAVFTVIGFPLVAVFLLIRALASKGIVNSDKVKGEYVSYEEVNEDFLDLTELTEKTKKTDNDYKDVFN